MNTYDTMLISNATQYVTYIAEGSGSAVGTDRALSVEPSGASSLTSCWMIEDQTSQLLTDLLIPA